MKSLLRVLTYLRPFRSLVLVTLVFAAITTALELVPPWLIKVVIDDVIQGQEANLLGPIVVALLLAYLIRNLCASLRIRLNNTVEQRVVHRLREQVFAALQRLSVSYYENRSTGEIMSRVVSDTEHVERIFIDGLEGMLTASLTLVGITSMLFWLNWKLAILALLPIPVLTISAMVFTKRVHGFYQRIRESAAEMNAYLQDALSGIRETIGFNRQGFEQERFSKKSLAYSENNLKAMYLWGFYSPGMMFIGSLGTVLIVWYGAGEVLRGSLTLGELVMFLSYLALFYVPINQIHSVNHMLQHALAASERVFEIIDTIPEVQDKPDAQIPSEPLQGAITFEQVHFRYRKDIPVLQGIDFSIHPGEQIALVGPSGAGKSTIVKLLLRYYDVIGGVIRLDGSDIRDLPLSTVRQQVGMVQQEPFLFNGTIRENILYGDLTAGQDRLEMVAEAARAHQFILDLPQGYDTWIGERGVKLSVGQKQRISIARVLLKNPPIVILDEATSNIDTETEVKIQEALENLTKDRTTLTIAHRLSTLHQADRILVVNAGRILEEGVHRDLLQQGGLYANLYEAQFSSSRSS